MTDQKAHASRDEPDPAEAAVSQQPTSTTTVDRATTDQATIPADDSTLERENHPLKSPGFKGIFGPRPLSRAIMHAP